jgi:hypothetical protein
MSEAMGEDSRPALMGLTREQVNTAMKDPDHLKRWLDASGRRFIVLKSEDVVDALWGVGDGVDLFIQLLAIYRDHRKAQPSGRMETVKDPRTQEQVQVSIPKGETLEIDELDRAIRWMINQASTLDPEWKLENPPL